MRRPVVWVATVGLATLVPVLLLLPRFRPDLGFMTPIGPLAASWIWVPAGLWVAAAVIELLGAGRRAAEPLRIAARTSVWVLLGLVILDPARNAPDAVATAFAAGWQDLLSRVRPIVTWLIGAAVVGGIGIALIGSGSTSAPTSRKAVTTGSAIGPGLALLLRTVSRLVLWLVGLMLELVWLAVAWTLGGVGGVRLVRGSGPDEDGPMGVLVRGRSLTRTATANTGTVLGRASSGWGRRTEHGVWVLPAALERDAEGEVRVSDWPDRGLAPDERQLRELALGLLSAYDVAIAAGGSGGRGRGPESDFIDASRGARSAPRPTPHRIEVARAWTRPGLLCVVLRASPSTAAAVMAKVPLDALVPSLDATTGWTAEDLRGLRLSDRRVADDELRADATGLFIALETAAEEESPVGAEAVDPVRTAIERALRDAGHVRTFRHLSTDDGWDATTVEFGAPVRDAADWKRLDEIWRAAQPGVALALRMPGVRLEARLESASFICVVPKPAAEFPGPAVTDWDAVTAAHPHSRRNRSRAVLGLDVRSEPVYLDLQAAPHWLHAGSTGSGKSSAMVAVLMQLLEANRPDQLRLWLLDSVKRELSRLLGDAPHTDRVTIADDGDAVVACLTTFVEAMDARYRSLDGRPHDPDRDPRMLLVIEEWAALAEMLDRRQMDTVVRLVGRVGAVGRAAGFHLWLISQRASVDILPGRLKVHLAGRVCGFLPSPSDYQTVLGVNRRVLPNVRGRLAHSVDGSTITIVQAVHIPHDRVREKVAEWRARSAPAVVLPAGDLFEGIADIGDDPLTPHRPTPAEVTAGDVSAVGRLLLAWQAEQDEPLVVSVRGLIGRVRQLGYQTGRVESYTAALARLEQLGVLEPVGDHATAARRLAVGDWATARGLIEGWE